MRTRIIAVTGGIGAGKSVICNILRAKGMRVYDCDARARAITEQSPEIRAEIARRISPEAITENGMLDRKRLADIVFADSKALATLNSIVHGAVRTDLRAWAERHSEEPLLFVETAILYQSGLDRMVHSVWDVVAPNEIRIQRVMARNNLTVAEVESRIKAQEYTPDVPHANIHEIVNDGFAAVLPQVNRLLS